MKLKIRQKILLYILTVSAALYVVAIGYIVINSRQGLLNESLNNSKLSTRLAASDVKLFFEKDLSLVRTLSHAFTVYNTMKPEVWQKLWVDMYLPVFKANPHIYTLWDSWEFSGYIPGYDKDYGRIAHTVNRTGNEVSWDRATRSLTGDPVLYGGFKKDAIEALWEPYYDNFIFGNMEQRLLTTIGSPVMVNGKFVGMVGVDVVLTTLQENIAKIKPFEGSVAFLVSNKSLIAAHPNKEFINTKLADLYKEDFKKERLGDRIQKGEEFSYYHTDSLGNKYYICYAPVKVSDIPTCWSLAISTPVKVLTQKADKTLYVSLIVGLVGLLVIIVVLIFVSDNLARPIRKITNSLKHIAKGEISNDLILSIKTGDEIEEMAMALNTSIEGLNQKASFAVEIGKGHYESDLEKLSDKDVLSQSLIDMRNSLKLANIEEVKRKVEDQKRTWANEGHAKFAEILRQNNNDFQALCDNVNKNLVKYLEANQGGIFLWNEEDKNDKFFELITAYAWDRKKHVTKRIEKGEGLVGACAMEKETIYMTDVPENYISITSGLGSANPRCIVLVPLKYEDAILGVLELASFKVIEKFQIEFLEKIAENIAATIQSVRINAKTKYLLEQSQQQAEEMAAQEEEMRQNMEELQATQEEAARKAGEIEGLINSLNAASYMVEYDMNGNITNVNDAFIHRLGVSRDQLIGTHHSGNIEMTEKQKKEYGHFWDSLRSGFSQKIKSKINWNGKMVTFIETYIPIADGEGRIYKIMKLGNELDDFKD